MSFVFFDTETTGLSLEFDQIVHFAAIRTDPYLNELERFEIRSRICDHVVPDPEALLINRVRIAQLVDPTLPSHYQMVCAIQAKLQGWTPSIFAGFYSIGFDEEMLRRAFFRTLHSPYLTSTNRNGRADVLNLAMAAVATSSASLCVPTSASGKRSFKLADLAAANGIRHVQAHSAMSDVEATIGLCRLIQERAPQAWTAFNRFSNKATTVAFVEGEGAFVLTEYFAGEAYHTPVVCLGEDPADKNKRLCLTLNSSARALLSASDEEVKAAFSTKPSPLRRVRVNAGPSLTALYEIDELNFELDEAELEALAEEVKNDEPACRRLIDLYASHVAPWPKKHYVEQKIYEGFIPDGDQQLCLRFHQADWSQRASILGYLRDERLRTLGMRLIHEESPSVLSPQDSADVRRMLALRYAGQSGPRSLDEAIASTDALLLEVGDLDAFRLREYQQYLVARRKAVS